MKKFSCLLFAYICLGVGLNVTTAETKLPSHFSDHMVLQRNQANPVWGWSNPGTEVSVSFAGSQYASVANATGAWRVELNALPAGGPHVMEVVGDSSVRIEDIWVGEVWVCGGQSNMQWPLERANHAEVEIVSANYPGIRLLSVPRKGTQEPQKDFEGE